MTAFNKIDADIMREYLEYDSSVGGSCLIWKKSFGNNVLVGQRAGKLSHQGYWRVRIDGKDYMAHRVVWALNKEDSPYMLDHIDRNKDNNRIENLRECQKGDIDNGKNRSIQKNNTSGHQGVCWDKPTKKWKAQIKVEGKCIHLGLFHSIDEAVSARLEAKKKYHSFSEEE